MNLRTRIPPIRHMLKREWRELASWRIWSRHAGYIQLCQRMGQLFWLAGVALVFIATAVWLIFGVGPVISVAFFVSSVLQAIGATRHLWSEVAAERLVACNY